jgi:protoheme IX farnesyltransferase
MKRSYSHFTGLVLAAAIVTFVLMSVGTAVRVMDAAQACPDWPTCYGQWDLPQGISLAEPVGVQVAHRVLAVLAALLTGAAAVWAMLRYRAQRWVTWPLVLATGIMLLEALMGSELVLNSRAGLEAPLHLGLALAAFGLVAAAATAAFYHREAGQSLKLAYRSRFARLAVATLLGLFLLLFSGTLVSAAGAGTACQGWPLCSGGLPQEPLGWLALGHRLIVLVSGGLLAAQFLQAWKSQRSQRVLLPAATGAFLLLLGQVYIGAANALRGFPPDLVGLHAAASAGLWAVQVILAIAAGFEARSTAEELEEAAEPLPLGRRFKDFIILSKPIIVLLLLVTTYAGMVVGGKTIPSADLTIWTLLGGALAAGGASALNQYIDRETDKEMQRTAKRPLPAGRLKPAEGLAYGLGACLAAFFLLAGSVNLLAAVLSLAGMIYYVLIYSVWLKHITVQNIVIGGGAGAIPPLVGWAAATGGLNIPALFLFAIIFLWTPPHFWALALVRTKDYARGHVPMLPVIRGEVETRKQILIYTIELVALTLLLPVLDMAGTVYLVSAAALGLWLISAAWRVYRQGGNKLAWKMYRYSSMYLAFLMLAMVIDVLV